ncbi:SMC-Scp complex subunit ScpB [Planctomycetota bacterium]
MTEQSQDLSDDQPSEVVEQDSDEVVTEQTQPGSETEEEQIEMPDEEVKVTAESVVEAVLFASDESLSVQRLANIIETGTKQIRQHVEALNEKYKAGNSAFRIAKIAGGFQMLTLSPFNEWLRKLLRVRSDNKLSPAALETLAIIAYKQPVIRADIEAIRGVAAGEMIRSLMYKGLVKIIGRAEIIGRPMLYGTTKKFLEIFGLNTLKDLPKIEELKKPQ